MSKLILDSAGVRDTVARLAGEIVSVAAPGEELVLVGIHTGGVYLAQRLRQIIGEKVGTPLTGAIDINLYRDDWTRTSPKPVVRKTELDFSIDDKRVVLVDDVLFTGRTVRSAMDALIDFGRPSRIELTVLIDRGHRELPICADFCGVTVKTGLDERVNVYFSEEGQEDAVVVEPHGSGGS